MFGLEEFEAIRAYRPPIVNYRIDYATNGLEVDPAYSAKEVGMGETPFEAYEHAKSLLSELVDTATLPISLPADLQARVNALQAHNAAIHYIVIFYNVEGY